MVGGGNALPTLDYARADTTITTDSALEISDSGTIANSTKPAKAVFAHYMVLFHYSFTGVENKAYVGRLEPSLKITLDRIFRVLIIWE